MPNFDKTHDPRQNKVMLEQMAGSRLDLDKLIQESLLLGSCNNSIVPKPLGTPSVSISKKLTAERYEILEPTQLLLDHDDNVIPDWKKNLDKEYKQLDENTKKEINVVDCGAIGDGKTDCTLAFKKAIGNGRVKVLVPLESISRKELDYHLGHGLLAQEWARPQLNFTKTLLREQD